MRTLSLAIVALAGAALAQQPARPNLVTRPMPPLEGTPQKVGGAGYFPLPPQLAVDPRKIPIPPLDFKVVKPEKVTLANGLTVYLIEDHAVPLISVRALLWAGDVDEVPAKLGVSDLTFELLATGGAGDKDASALDEQLELLAADVGGSAGEEYSSFGINLRSQDLPQLFPLWTRMLLEPRFQQDRFEVAQGRMLESVRRRPDSPDGLAMRALRKAVYGPDSVLGREMTEKTLRAVKVADLKAFHKKMVIPKATSLLVTGDFDRKQMLPLIEKHLGAWKGGERPVRTWTQPAPLKRRVILVPKQIAQAKIRIGGFGYARLSPQEYPIRVVNTALGSFGVGRLYKEVRDTRGLAYSAYASVSPGPTTGLFFAGADTKPATAAKAIEAELQILDEAAGKKPITKEEISIASDMYLNSFAFRFDAPEKIAREKAVFDLFGYPDDYLDTYRANIAKVDVASALEAAKKLARMDELQIVIVGPPDKLGDLSVFGPITTITDVEAFK
jgi:zinc protease